MLIKLVPRIEIKFEVYFRLNNLMGFCWKHIHKRLSLSGLLPNRQPESRVFGKDKDHVSFMQVFYMQHVSAFCVVVYLLGFLRLDVWICCVAD